MKLEFDPGCVILTLSKRNLLALLQKADDPLSIGVLASRHVYSGGELISGIVFLVRCESDATHYEEREPPGPMHPRTEEFIARFSGRRRAGVAGRPAGRPSSTPPTTT
jgi:hypothetical protein